MQAILFSCLRCRLYRFHLVIYIARSYSFDITRYRHCTIVYLISLYHILGRVTRYLALLDHIVLCVFVGYDHIDIRRHITTAIVVVGGGCGCGCGGCGCSCGLLQFLGCLVMWPVTWLTGYLLPYLLASCGLVAKCWACVVWSRIQTPASSTHALCILFWVWKESIWISSDWFESYSSWSICSNNWDGCL